VPGEVVARQLLGAERLLPQLDDRRAPPGRVEVGEVAGGRERLGASKTRGSGVGT
jgi:hypothetical protein